MRAFFLLLLFSFYSVDAFATENLTSLDTLKKHFDNKEQFTHWYKSLNQTDKNQVLAGTVVLCRSDLTDIALKQGGDINTPVFYVYQHAGYCGLKCQGVNNIYTTNFPYLINDFHKREFAKDMDIYLSKTVTSLLSQGILSCHQEDEKLKMAKLLLKNGANVNIANKYGENAFEHALLYLTLSESQNKYSTDTSASSSLDTTRKLIKLLLEYFPDENWNKEVTTGAIIYALSLGDAEIIAMIRQKGFKKIKLNTQSAKGAILYNMYMSYNFPNNASNIKTLKKLISSGVDLNDSGANGILPLLYVVDQERYSDKKGLIELMLKSGAHVDVQYADGKTPLALAVERESTEIAQKLIEYGADVLIPDIQGVTAFESCKTSKRDVCKIHPLGLKYYNMPNPNLKNKDLGLPPPSRAKQR